MTNQNSTQSPDLSDAVAAHAKVRETIAALLTEHQSVVAEIGAIKSELDYLPTLPVPFEDMKEAILDYVAGSGEKWGPLRIRSQICEFAIGKRCGDALVPHQQVGKPLSFAELELAREGQGKYFASHFLSGGYNQYFDQILFAVAGNLVKDALRRVMSDISPEEFGYNKLAAKDIGEPRAERRQHIEKLNARLAELESHREILEANLVNLGHRFTLR